MLVREAAALVDHRFSRAGVTLLPAVSADAPRIRCEPLLFKHALVNLLLNACEASPRGSTVRVEVHADAAEVAFIVSDEGHGITPEHVARAKEPFFTTKGEGSGLGLAIANEIATTHRGSLHIDATLAEGHAGLDQAAGGGAWLGSSWSTTSCRWRRRSPTASPIAASRPARSARRAKRSRCSPRPTCSSPICACPISTASRSSSRRA